MASLKQEREFSIDPLNYYREQGFTIFKNKFGWASLEIFEDSCYIQDLYISPGARLSGKATLMATAIEEVAKSRGCKFLTTSINTCGKIDVTRSMKAVVSYGFIFQSSHDGYLIFKKEIS